MRVTLICNPGSGRGVDPAWAAERLRAHGHDVVEVADTADDVSGRATERVVAIGGDGTVGAAAELAHRRAVPLATVPGGTANDFVRATGLPCDLEPALELAATGTRTRPLELAWMGDRPFVNAASAGLSPAAGRRATPLKPRLGPLAYPVGGLLAGLRERPIAATAVVDEQEVFDGATWQLTVAATGAFGGGAEIEAADPQDGLLDLVAVPAGSRLVLPRIALALRRGGLEDRPDVVHVRGDVIRVRVAPGTCFNVDGEVVQGGGDHAFRAQAAAFELVVG
jgi:diacylglycerol kinase family enzyme